MPELAINSSISVVMQNILDLGETAISTERYESTAYDAKMQAPSCIYLLPASKIAHL
jgi:hypothetical protein